MVKHGPKGPRALTQNTFINIYLLSSASATVCALSKIYNVPVGRSHVESLKL